MILLKQKRKTYTPPEIEVTEYEVDESLAEGSVWGEGHGQQGSSGWDDDDAKAFNSFDDEEDDYADDFNYQSYRSEMLW